MDTNFERSRAALNGAADMLGGQVAIARACGYDDRRHVWPWFNTGRWVPAEKCGAIELATKGEVLCEELRPDVRWARIPDPAWPHPAGRPCIDVAAPEHTTAGA